MRRSRFGDGPELPGNSDYADNTKYNEKYVMPTRGTAPDFGTSSVYSEPTEYPGQVRMFNDPMTGASRGASQHASSITPQNGAQNTSEAPMVFALRSDPSLYVYEYSDKLEYYRHTPTGMMLCNIEYKKPR